MKKRQIDQRTTKQVRIDTGYHKMLKLEAFESGKTIKEALHELLVEYFGPIEKK